MITKPWKPSAVRVLLVGKPSAKLEVALVRMLEIGTAVDVRLAFHYSFLSLFNAAIKS